MDKVYLVDVGVLYDNADIDEYNSYNTVYDHKHAYYDEGQFYLESYDEAKNFVNSYVKNGVPFTYGIVCETDSTLNEAEEIIRNNGYNSIADIDVEFSAPEYGSIDSIVYSLVKSRDENRLFEDFVGKSYLVREIGLSDTYQSYYARAFARLTMAEVNNYE